MATLKALAAHGYSDIDLTKADQIDCDGDGNYNEPDGYIDHFTVVQLLGCKLGGYQIRRRRLAERL